MAIQRKDSRYLGEDIDYRPPLIPNLAVFLCPYKTMVFLIKCPNCCRNITSDASAADRRLKCPLCGKLFKVPDTNEYRNASKIITSSKTSLYVDQQGKTFG